MDDVFVFEGNESVHHLHSEVPDLWFAQDFPLFYDIIE